MWKWVAQQNVGPANEMCRENRERLYLVCVYLRRRAFFVLDPLQACLCQTAC